MWIIYFVDFLPQGVDEFWLISGKCERLVQRFDVFVKIRQWDLYLFALRKFCLKSTLLQWTRYFLLALFFFHENFTKFRHPQTREHIFIFWTNVAEQRCCGGTNFTRGSGNLLRPVTNETIHRNLRGLLHRFSSLWNLHEHFTYSN